MKIFRNAPSVWLDKSVLPVVLDHEGKPASWVPILAASQATIEIQENQPEWEAAYQRWQAGKNPTDDPRWKLGMFLCWT